MTAVRKGSSRVARAVLIGAATVGLTMAGSAGTASAAVGDLTATLSISAGCQNPGEYALSASGTVKMPKAEAERRIAQGYRVAVRIWGDDDWTRGGDDWLGGPYYPYLTAKDDGIYYGLGICVTGRYLNEDDGEDDIYAGVRFLNPDDGTVKSKESNRVYGNY